MSKHHPAPGKYYIVNISGESPLSITFNGLYTAMNVTELQKLSTQVWVVSDEVNGLQGISPLNGLGLYIIPGDDHNLMASASPGGLVWSIKGNDNIYTIQTKDDERVWDIDEAKAGQAVIWHSRAEVKNQHWEFVPA